MGDQDNGARSVFARLKRRYRDAYSLATLTAGAGDFTKGAAVVLGTLIALVAVSFGNTLITLGGFLFAGTVGLVLFVLGLLISAQGQLLRANLDSTVNSFPNLTESEKNELMKL